MHDNTQSYAHENSGHLCRDYLHLISLFQAEGAPFLGYLHSGGYCVARTDRQPTSRVSYRQRIDGKWSDCVKDVILDTRLQEMRDAPEIYDIISAKALPEKQWRQMSRAAVSGIRKAAQKIWRNQGFGQPYLLETVESDGETTTYTRYG
jgi:hypothetical protein